MSSASLALFVMTASALTDDQADSARAESAILARADSEFHKGKEASNNPAKAQEHFARAAAAFTELRRRGVHNADLYLNLGNASVLAGDLAGAILAYRGGLRLAPNDRALRANLRYARSRVQYPTTTRPPQPDWPVYPTPLSALIVAFGFYGLSCAAWLRRLITERGALLATALSSAAVAAAVVYAFTAWQAADEERRPLVVVARDHIPLHRGNGDSYPPHPDVPHLNEGMEARRLFQRGDWLQIQLPDGALGWVHKDSVLVDLQ
jgi:hypothetical protein